MGPDSGVRLSAALGAAVLGIAVLASALQGGSYDVVPRTESFAVVWWALTLGAMLSVLPRRRPPPAALLGLALLAGFVGWTALSMLWTDGSERTYAEVARSLGFVGVVALIGGTVSPLTAIRASVALTAAAVAVCVVALVARLAPGTVSASVAASAARLHRLSFPFDYWNAMGCWAAMTAALALAWSVQAERRWARGLALAALPVAGVVAYLTYSRAALIGLAIALIASVALSSRRWTAAVHVLLALGATAVAVATVRAHPAVAEGTGTGGAGIVAAVVLASASAIALAAAAIAGTWLDRARLTGSTTRRLVVAATAVLVVSAAVWGPALARNAWASFRGAGTFQPSDTSARLGDLGGPRRAIWAVALETFASHPVRGVGAGTFELRWTRDRKNNLFVRDAHSLVIESLAELGIVGGVLIVSAFVALFAGALASRFAQRAPPAVATASGGLAAFLAYCAVAAIDWMWESTAVTIAGLAAVSVAAASAGRASKRPRLPLRLAWALVGLVALLVQLPLLVASTNVDRSQEAFARGDLESAVLEATVAAEAEPWAATPLLQRATVLEAGGSYDRARSDAAAAVQRASSDWRPWIILARIEAERGRIRAAQRNAERARSLNPRSPLFAAAAVRARTPARGGRRSGTEQP